MTFERRGKLSTMGLTVANPNILTGQAVIVAQYLRRMTSRLDLGAEYVYQREPRMAGPLCLTCRS
jgi:hypothetical protein